MVNNDVEWLKERVAYLERSNNRREESIIYLRDENIELSSKIDELRSWLEDRLDNENDIFSVVRVRDVIRKLNELEGGKNE